MGIIHRGIRFFFATWFDRADIFAESSRCSTVILCPVRRAARFTAGGGALPPGVGGQEDPYRVGDGALHLRRLGLGIEVEQPANIQITAQQGEEQAGGT